MNAIVKHSQADGITRCVAAKLVCSLAAAATLSACVVAPPPGPILSRLPPDAPGAAEPARPLTNAEKKRYDEIDKQVLREQDAAIAEESWARYYSYTPYYAPAIPAYGYGGYYNGGGVGYYSPGFYPGWWW